LHYASQNKVKQEMGAPRKENRKIEMEQGFKE
jgi:hypothetical protein